MIALPPWNRSLGLNSLLQSTGAPWRFCFWTKMTCPALIVHAGRAEVGSWTEGNSRERRQSHWQLCQTAKIDAAIWEATVALLLRSWRAGLATWAPSRRAGFCWQNHSPASPGATGSSPVRWGWCNTSSRPQLLYPDIVMSIQFIPL